MTSALQLPTLMNAKQVAEHAGMSVEWVYRRVALGEIPYVTLSGSIRFNPEEINRYLRGEWTPKSASAHSVVALRKPAPNK